MSDCSKVSLRCSQCRGDQLNWDQPFAVSASCDQCNAAPQHIRFSWSLYLVDASSKPVVEGNKRLVGRQQRHKRKPPQTFPLLFQSRSVTQQISALRPPSWGISPLGPRRFRILQECRGTPLHSRPLPLSLGPRACLRQLPKRGKRQTAEMRRQR